MFDWNVLVAPLFTSALTAFGVYVSMSNRIAILETKLDEFAKKVDKHNQIVERTFKLESDSNTMWRRIDESRERIERLEELEITK